MGRKKLEKVKIKKVDELVEDRVYPTRVLQNILKNYGLPYSIYTIRDAETWKCLDYTCGARHNKEVIKCKRCGGTVRPPLIPSPRTRLATKGWGHRRYSKEDIQLILDIFRDFK